MKHAHPLAAAVATMLLVGASGEWLGRPGSRVAAIQPGQPAPGPIAVRNERPRAGREVLVLRHQQLRKGAHDDYYRASRAGVWPWYEQIGTRVVGQWLVTERDGGAADATADDAYRLARYASVEHWRATRDPANVRIGGNGPDHAKSLESGRDRAGVQTGSKGAYFLEGENAPTRPLYMPALAEQYEAAPGAPDAADPIVAVRHEAAKSGREVVELRYQRIAKGAFDRFVADTRDAVWPWEEKLGARPIGQWKVIYPDAASRTKENPDYDEVVTLTRYASRDHWQAMAPNRVVLLGGNGPDWNAWRAARDAQARLTRETSVELMQGEMYNSPPIFTPALAERYRLSR